ncbi:hypothetical protein ACJRO7_032285 [Eucalyptus globulus]|uniref:Uncharacterized protein n=1 Tax=Eucalyptus globulus TaxID=34317 RepID=A0ABD3JMT8_EUCGL
MEAIRNAAALLVQQEINNAASQGTGTAADVKDITEHPEPEQEEENKEVEETKAEDEDREEEKRVEEEKEIELEQEQELEPETEPLVEEEEAEPGKFTSHDSPDHYFSPRRDEEVPEGIVSEGLSSGYNLPWHELVKEGEYDKVVAEEKNPTGLEKEEEMRKKENDCS